MTSPTSPDVAAEIKAELVRQGLSPRELAQQVSIPHTTLARRLRGQTPFTITELGSICAALKITVSQLIQDAERAVARRCS